MLGTSTKETRAAKEREAFWKGLASTNSDGCLGDAVELHTRGALGLCVSLLQQFDCYNRFRRCQDPVFKTLSQQLLFRAGSLVSAVELRTLS